MKPFHFHALIILLSTVVLSSCRHGYYVPRTANVPMLDSTNTSNFRLGINLSGTAELQHNKLLSDRLFLQNNAAIRTSTWTGNLNGVVELGAGYFLDNGYNRSILIGAGYSYQNYEYLHSEITGFDASYVHIKAEDQPNYFAQYTHNFFPNNLTHNACAYSRVDFCLIQGKFSRNIPPRDPIIGTIVRPTLYGARCWDEPLD